MDWITDRVAIGNYLEAQDVELLRANGFRSAVSLDGTLSPGQAAELGLAEVVSYRLIDGAGNDLRVVRFAIDDVERLARDAGPVLVHCRAGRSRSVAVVAGYLARTTGHGTDAALAEVAARRETAVASELVELLRRL